MSTITIPRRRLAGRRVARIAIAIGVSVVIGLSLVEVVLRLAPDLVRGHLANAVYSRYHTSPGGIYFHDRETRMYFMRPDVATRCYWNGYYWEHRADAQGYRNAPGTASDGLLLLGDSMIYGHGVNEEETVAFFLRNEHGRSAYNMGRSGDTLYHEYIRARLALARLQPERLVLFVFLNDFNDMTGYRKPDQIADPPELERYDYAALAARVREPGRDSPLKQLRRLRVLRVFKGLRKGPPAAPVARPDQRVVHPLIASILDDERFAPVADYYRRVLRDLAARARAQGVEFSVVLLDVGDEVNHSAVPDAVPAQDRLYALLSEIGSDNDFRVLSTRQLFLGCSECFLPDDGHLTREGHRRLAAFIDHELPATTAR